MKPTFCIAIASLILLYSALIALSAESLATDTQAPPNFAAVGFATLPGYGIEHLTGGSGGKVFEVRTAAEFQTAVERTEIKKKTDRDLGPRIVKVMADLDLGSLANEKPGNEIKSVGRVEVASNTTIFAPGTGAIIRRGILEVHGANNVIIRNLKFRDLWENDPTGKYDKFGWDYVRITRAGKIFSHHVWIDHCDFGKCYDGQCDITHGSDLVTVSWCHFAGDERGPHKKSMLIGHSSSTTAQAEDTGRLNVTLHHNWFENIEDRAPRARWGNFHIFNDFVDGAENATISVMNAVTLAENCVYNDARIATTFSHAADAEDKDHAGTICLVGCQNTSPRLLRAATTERLAFENSHNFQSNVERDKLKFNPVTNWHWPNPSTVPYTYQMDPVESVPKLVRQFSGTGKIPDESLLLIGR